MLLTQWQAVFVVKEIFRLNVDSIAQPIHSYGYFEQNPGFTDGVNYGISWPLVAIRTIPYAVTAVNLAKFALYRTVYGYCSQYPHTIFLQYTAHETLSWMPPVSLNSTKANILTIFGSRNI